MNITFITANIAKELVKHQYPTGQAIYTSQAINHSSQDDESEILTIIITGNMPRFTEEETEKADLYCDLETKAYNELLKAFNPANILKPELPEVQGLEFTKIPNIEGISQTGVSPNLWITPCNDSFMVHGTDATIYIQIIQSGQY